MKITSISYGVVKNIGNYENIRLSATCEIEEETPEEALDRLRQWVDQQSSIHSEIRALAEEKSRLLNANETLKYKFDNALAQWGKLQSRWEQAKEFLKLHGIEVTGDLPKLAPDWQEKVMSQLDKEISAESDDGDDSDDEDEEEDEEERYF